MSQSNSPRRSRLLVSWLVLALVPGVAFAAMLSLRAPVAFGNISGAGLEPVLLRLGWWVGLILAGWLIVSQLLYTIAVVTRTHWLLDLLRPVTAPLVRRAAAGLATVTISLSTITAMAQTPTETTVVTVDMSSLRQEATPTPILQPLVEVEIEKPCAENEPSGSYGAPLTWRVRPGDHLWKIAGEHLSIVLDRPPTEDEHARYWVEVIDSARPVIRSGDPDLIYPGEEIPLPPTLDAGVRP